VIPVVGMVLLKKKLLEYSHGWYDLAKACGGG